MFVIKNFMTYACLYSSLNKLIELKYNKYKLIIKIYLWETKTTSIFKLIM